jgi:ABC-type uncharacterized transport system YnjBCD ATPase subunit
MQEPVSCSKQFQARMEILPGDEKADRYPAATRGMGILSQYPLPLVAKSMGENCNG